MPREARNISNGKETAHNGGTNRTQEQDTSPERGTKMPKEKETVPDEAKMSSAQANTARSFRLGLFIVGSLIILSIGIFLIGNREMLFTSTYSLKSNFHTVAGLSEGADVRVGGIHQGTVKRIDLPKRPDEQVTVSMDMHRATSAVLKNDSVASIKSEGLLGDKYVEISFGSPDAPKLKNGDTIASAPPLDISDLIAKTSTILDSTKGAVENIEGAADNLKSFCSKKSRRTIGG